MDEPDGTDTATGWATVLILSLNYQYLIGVVLGCFVVRHAIRLVYHAATARRRKGFAYSSVEGESAENDSAEGRYRIVELAQRVDGWLQESPSLSGWRRVELLFTAGIIAINVLFSFIVAAQYSSMQSFASNWIRVYTLGIGRLAMHNLPLLFALVGRSNNPISLLTGIDTKWLHNVLGYVVFGETVVHVVGWSAYVVAGWGWTAIWAEMQMRFFQVGILSTIGGILCVVFSIRWIRSKKYELFLVTHVIGAALFLGGLFYHHPSCEAWVYAIAAFWIVERLARLVHNFFSINLGSFHLRRPLIESTATIQHGAVLLSIPFKGAWTAGQYVHVRFMGLDGFANRAQSHPFSIVNAPRSSEKDDSPQEIQLVIRIKQGITLTLAQHILSRSSDVPASCALKVSIEGPYGSAPAPAAEEYRDLILFAGGSGVTHPASVLDGLLSRVDKGEVGTESIKLFWAVQHLDQMTWLQSQLERNLLVASQAGIELKIEIYITQSSTAPIILAPLPSSTPSIHSTHSGESTPLLPLDRIRSASSRIEDDDSTEGWIEKYTAVRVHHGRPDVTALLLARLDEIVGRTLVVGCGPESMTDKIRWCVSSLESREVDLNIASYDC